MNNFKINKGLFLLGLLSALTFLLLGVLLNWIDDAAFSRLEKIMSYKWMILIFLIIISLFMFFLAYIKIFGNTRSKQFPEKLCPKCGKPTLEIVKSTVRSVTYKCNNCGFDHHELKEGQTNIVSL